MIGSTVGAAGGRPGQMGQELRRAALAWPSWVAALCAALALSLVPARAQESPPGAPTPPVRVLMVTATAGFHHDSIATAQEVLRRLARDTGQIEVTLLPDLPDLAALTPALLARQDVVFFANTSGELPLDGVQKQSLLDFVAAGGGFAGTHSATDTFYDWPEYEALVGAHFKEHPWTQPATVDVEDQAHPLTAGLGPSFDLLEEFYVFRTSPRERAHVLLRLDGAAVSTTDDVPLAWCGTYGAGRTYYNALGHFDSTWLDPRFQRQLLAALRWTAGRSAPGGDREGDACLAPAPSSVLATAAPG